MAELIKMDSGINLNKERVTLINNFIKASEIEIIPILEQMGAKLIKKIPNEIAFSFKEIDLSIYLEREYEVYGTVSSSQLKQTVYISELLSDYLNIEDKAIYNLSERSSMEVCLRKLVDIITLMYYRLLLMEELLRQ